MDEWKRFANAAVQEELIARTEALRAKYPFDTPELLKPDDLEHAATRAARDPGALEAGGRRAARPGAGAVAPLPAGRRSDPGPRPRVLREAGRRAQGEPRTQDGADRAGRSARRLDRLGQDGRRVEEAPGRVAGRRPRAASGHPRRPGSGSARRATASSHAATPIWRSARRPGPRTSRTRKRSAPAPRSWRPRRDWDRAAAEIRRLQADWKTSGPVRRNKSEAVWQRFRAACDTFFDRYKRRDEIELEAKQADREALVTEIETLAGAPQGEPAEILERVRSLRTRWNQSTPVVRQGADPLSARFVAALERLTSATPDAFKGTELDVEANRQRMEKLIAKVEGFVTAAAPPTAGSRGARQHAARGARHQHHRRTRRRGIEVARHGRRRARRPRTRGTASARCPATPDASSPNGSTRRATASSTSTAARSRSPQGDGTKCRMPDGIQHSLSVPDLPADDRVDHLRGGDLVFRHRQDVLREDDQVGVLAGLQRPLALLLER